MDKDHARVCMKSALVSGGAEEESPLCGVGIGHVARLRS